MSKRTHIVVAEPADIIRLGIVEILRKMPDLDIDIAQISKLNDLPNTLSVMNCDVLLINPISSPLTFANIKELIEKDNFHIVALKTALSHHDASEDYDESISIYDSASTIKEKIVKILDLRKDDSKTDLTQREKDVLVCIVKGLSNKQIADTLFLSTHTIMTHRRNIVAKLQIHSVAGLTIYAIVNKLVSLDKIKESIDN